MKLLSRITICETETTREYPPRPLIGVGAIIIKGLAVVLVRRAKEPSKGEWSIPGGLVKVGETLTDAVRREAFEETRLTVRPGPMIKLVERIFSDFNKRVKYHYIIADYRCSVINGELIAGSDASEACWAHKESLQDYGLADVALEIIDQAFESCCG
ncbi:MAG: NUDIX hydrolase [Pseudomonadota bacterium]